MRLDKLLSAGLGLGSRTDVKKMIRAGRVRVEGFDKVKPETGVDPKRDSVYVDGKIMEYREFVYLMLNKPAGVISATRDGRHKTVLDLVPEEYLHFDIFPVGRLDIDTEGLCLLTNDGALAHRLLSPKHHIFKTYYAEINMPLGESDIELFKSGIVLDDGYVCMPAELEICSHNAKCAYVKICEGKFHQIKRMFESTGKSVLYLKRIKMHNLTLDENLPLGEIRELTDEEINGLYA